MKSQPICPGASGLSHAQNADSCAVITAVNDEEVLACNLAASPCIAEDGVELIVERGRTCASIAYNLGLSRANQEIIVFAHQDVYLPRGWPRQLMAAVRHLDMADPKWAVLGVFGLRANGKVAGRLWSSGLAQAIGQPMSYPQPIVSLDEVVLILKASCGLRFDEGLPAFHLYGTDLVQTALQGGFGAYAFDGPVIHNSRPVRRLDRKYYNAYRYMQHKWRSRLPLQTTVMPITRYGWPLIRHWTHATKHRLLGEFDRFGRRHDSPAMLAQELGYEARL